MSDQALKANDALPTTDELFAELLIALKEFGEYTFRDKGPQEVMDLEEIALRLRDHPAEDVASVLRGLAHSGEDEKFRRIYASHAAGAVVLQLEDWDELFEQPGIDELHGLCMPELQPGDQPAGQAAVAAGHRPSGAM